MNRGPVILKLARESLAESFGGASPVIPAGAPWLKDPGACFITLRKDDELRGCVGSVAVRRPLGEDVIDNAKAAAFRDPRFEPLSAFELPQVKLEATVLTAPESVPVASEEEALRAIEPGKHGVILSYLGRSAVFIPKMWDQLPDPHEFLFYLKRKGGLPQQWPFGMKLSLFTAEEWEES